MKTPSIVRLGLSLIALTGAGSAWLSLHGHRQKKNQLELKHTSLSNQEKTDYSEQNLSFSIQKDPSATFENLDIIQDMAILGVSPEYNVFYAENQPDGGVATQMTSISIPAGTTQVIPMLVGFELGYVGDDHHIHTQYLNVQVNELSSGGATIETDVQLNDNGGDKPWHGKVTARFLFLAPLPAGASGQLTILGIRNQLFDAGHQPDASHVVSFHGPISTPVGTTRIMPFLVRFALTFDNDDHHLAFELVGIEIDSIDMVNATADVRMAMLLSDKDKDKPWSGFLNAMLLFLGPRP